MNRIFIDMDGVVANFFGLKMKLGVDSDTLKKMPHAYAQLEPMPGAIEAVRVLMEMGYACWIATKPPTGIAHAYADKAQWILNHLPELKRRIIMTPDKGLLGDHEDYLIDDRPHKANCEMFRGQLIVFHHQTGWSPVLDFFRNLQP